MVRSLGTVNKLKTLDGILLCLLPKRLRHNFCLLEFIELEGEVLLL